MEGSNLWLIKCILFVKDVWETLWTQKDEFSMIFLHRPTIQQLWHLLVSFLLSNCLLSDLWLGKKFWSQIGLTKCKFKALPRFWCGEISTGTLKMLFFCWNFFFQVLELSKWSRTGSFFQPRLGLCQIMRVGIHSINSWNNLVHPWRSVDPKTCLLPKILVR